MAEKRFLDRYRDAVLKGFSFEKAISTDVSSELLKYKEKSKIPAMENFYRAMDYFGNNRKIDSRKPVVGFFCSVVPEEIIIACSLHPVRLCCEDQGWAQTGEEIVPGDICCVVKSICGKFYSHFYDGIDLVVVPGSCDPKTKLAEILSPLKEVYFLDTGKDCEYLKNVDIWSERYTDFFEFLKTHFHQKAGRKELLSACRKTNKRTDIFRKIYHLRAEYPDSISAVDYYIMINASFFMEVEMWSELAERVYTQALEEKKVTDKPRILLAGTPVIFPNFKIIDVIEQSGLSMAADIQCISFGNLFNPVNIDEDTESGIIRALTLKNIAGSICPCLMNLEKITNLILDTVKQYNIDGVIYYNLRLCQVFEIQTAILRQILKEKKIPFLQIKTDLGTQDIGQLKTRLEAFREMICLHKK